MITGTSFAPSAAAAAPIGGKWRATLLYSLLTLVLMYPVSLQPHRLLPADDTDTLLGLYMLSWDTHALTHRPWSIFDANMFYPYQHTLAYQDNLIGTAIFAAPVLWLTGNPVTAMTFVTMLSCVLCGLGAYVLARRVGLSEPAALLCGIFFSFCPARFFRIYQIGLAPAQWIPFTLASLHAYLDGGRRRDLWYALGFFTLQTFTSGHLALFLAAAIITLLAYRFLLGEPVRLVQRLRDFGFVGLLALLPAVLVYLPYRMNQAQVGLRRGLGSWGTTPESFLASPTPVDQAILNAIGLGFVNERASGFLFPGWVPVLFGLVAIGATAVGRLRSRGRLAISNESATTGIRVTIVAVMAVTALVAAAHTDTPLAWSRVEWLAVGTAIACTILLLTLRGQSSGRERRSRWLVPPIALWMACVAIKTAIPAGDGLAAQYYPNGEWDDPPAFASIDAAPTTTAVRRAWNGPPPPSFSVRWMGYINIPADGEYQFATASDDGSRMFVGRRQVVENSGPHPELVIGGAAVPLEAGSHRVVVEFTQLLGDKYAMQVLWARAGTPFEPVPSWMFSRRPSTYSRGAVVGVLQWIAWAAALGTAAGAVLWLAFTLPPIWKAWGERTAAIRRSPVSFYLVLAIVTIAISAGPPYSLWPYIYRWPGFSFVRAPLRFMVMGALPVAVLGGAGFDWVAKRFRPGWRGVFAGLVAAAAVAEFAAVPLRRYPYRVVIPAADRFVAQQPKPFVVAEVPVTTERYQTIYMLHSTAHWQRTVAGYGGIRPVISQQLNNELQTFPDANSVRHLAELGVTYVIVHIDMYPPGEWPAVEQRLREVDPAALKLEYSDEAGRVYSVNQHWRGPIG